MTKENLGDIVSRILKKIDSINSKGATVVTLEGELGTGKTTLTQELARIIGIKENVISPTFVIMKKYNCNYKNFKKLVHIDAYRLKSAEELLKLGFQEILEDKNSLVILEWPSLVSECIPKNALRVEISHRDDDSRNIEF